MGRVEIFWTGLFSILFLSLIGFLIFVSYIYYDTAITMRKLAQELSLKNNHLRRQISLNIDRDISRSDEDQDWQELLFEEVT